MASKLQYIQPFLGILALVATVRADFSEYRLPNSVKPEHYKIRLATHFADRNFTTEGQVWVRLRAEEDSRNITLHSKGLKIFNDSLLLTDVQSGDLVDITGHSQDIPKDFLNIQLGKPLAKGKKYLLYLQYEGRLAESLVGFYRSSYVDKATNETRWVASTVFEPTYARSAFPCFDEPAMKARFEVSLARRQNMTSNSNMPLKKSEPWESREGWVWDHYEASPPMSSYLVAFLISDFEARETEQKSGKPFRIFSRSDVSNQTEYVADIAPRILGFYGDLLRVEDPMPKQDFVVLPTFVADALENWGIVSFGENYLLHEPGVSSASSKYLVSSTTAHELAHQWFGNLVTLKWWKDIWLNEGFAIYYSVLGVDHVQPKWDILTMHPVRAFLKVFAVDALNSSHPLSLTINRPTELVQIFDTITYYKGYYMLRMLNCSLGEKTLSEAMSKYVARFQYKNAEQDDFWEVLTSQAHQDGSLPEELTVKEIMDTWTLQPGYPVVTVSRDYSDGVAYVSQRRFLRPKEELQGRARRDNTTWWIPLSYTTEENPDFTSTEPHTWMRADEEEITIQGLPGDDKWVMFNIETSGLYRVNYDLINWRLLARQLNSDGYDQIGVINRAQVLDDGLDFARAGWLSYDVALDVTNYLSREKHFLPWLAALSNLGYINKMTRTTPAYGKFKKFVRRLVSPLFQEIGFQTGDDEGLMSIMNAEQVTRWACRAGQEGCVGEAKDYFSQWMDESRNSTDNPVPVNLREVVYCTALEHGGEEEWTFLWNQFQNYSRGSEVNTYLAALGCTKELWLLKRYLDWSIQEDSGISKQDSATVFKAVAKNPVGFFLAKDFLRDNVKRINKYIGPHFFHMSSLVDAISRLMNQPDHMKELEELQANNKEELALASRALKQANERVSSNINWMQRNYDVILKWLEQHDE